MRFALLGDGIEALPLARTVLNDSRHTLVCGALAPRCLAELSAQGRRVRSCSGWEELLSDASIDAVIVTGDDETALTAARQLASASKALLIVPSPGQTSTFAYELALLQGESPVVLFPAFPVREHPFVRELREMLVAGELGRVHHLQLERRLAPQNSKAATALMATELLAEQFLVDVDVLRYLGGEYDQVTASRSGDEATGFSLASVMLAGNGVPQAIWSASAGEGDVPWRLTVAGEKQSVVLAGDPLRGELSWGNRIAATDEEGMSRVLEQFVRRMEGERSGPSWIDFTRAFELLDAVERSVRRRRTIDLHFETLSERSVFKTQMTALGCGLLVATLGAMVTYLIVATAFDLNATLKQVLRVLIFLPLGLFLALQLLLFVAKPQAAQDARNKTAD